MPHLLGACRAPGAILATVLAILDVERGWLGAALALLAVGLLASLLPPRLRRWFLVTNALALLALVWSLGESTPVSVSVRGDRIQARAGGELVQARDARYASGDVAVHLRGADATRAARARPSSVQENAWLEALLAPAYTGYRSGVDRLALGPEPGALRGPLWQSDAIRTETLTDEPLSDVALQLVALRAAAPFAVLARLNGGEGYQVSLQAESRDLVLSRVRDGRVVQELENRGSPFRKDWIAALQSVIRELGRTWLFALMLVAAGLALPRTRAGRLAAYQPGLPRALFPALLLCLSLLAVFVCAWLANAVFDLVPHDRDSVAYLFQARLFASGAASAPAPGLAEFFKEDFVVTHRGQWFGKYPPGHPLLLAGGVLLGAPWIVGPVLGGLAVLLVGWLGARLFGPLVGLAAAVLLLSSPFFLFMNGSYLAHPTALVLTQGALLAFPWRSAGGAGSRKEEAGSTGLPSFCFLLSASCSPGAPRSFSAVLVLLGFLLGALVCTRQLTGVAVGACLSAWLVLEPGDSIGCRARRAVLVLLGALPPVAFLLWFQWATTGSALMSPQLLWWEFDKIGFGPGVGAEGWHDPAMGLHDTWDRLTELQRHLFGWPFYLTLAPAMVPFISGRATRRDWWLLSVVVAIVGAYVLYWNRGMAYGPRYFYEALGPLCLLTVRGFQSLGASRAPSSKFQVQSGGRQAAAPLNFESGTWSSAGAALAIALVAFNVFMYLPQQMQEYRGYLGVDGRRARLVRDAGVERGLIFVREEPRGSWQAYASVFWLNQPSLDGALVFARDRGAEENARLQATMPDRPAYLLSQGALTPLDPR